MTSIECAEFLERVRRHWAFLFEQYDFAVIHQAEAPGGSRCLIVLESPFCRLRFIQNRWDLHVDIGTLAAPIDWKDSVQGIKYWYSIGEIFVFIKKTPFRIEDLLQEKPFLNIDQQLRELSRELQPVFGEVIHLFREDTFGQWQDEYKKWRDEEEREFQRQYKEWERKQRERRSSAHSGDESEE